MATPEAARHDLYTGLVELLGEDRASTLMAYLPTYDPSEVATKADIAGLSREMTGLKADVAELKTDVATLKTDVTTLKTDVATLNTDVAALNTDVAALGHRMDDRFHRLTLTLVGGLFVIVAAMAGVVVASLG